MLTTNNILVIESFRYAIDKASTIPNTAIKSIVRNFMMISSLISVKSLVFMFIFL